MDQSNKNLLNKSYPQKLSSENPKCTNTNRVKVLGSVLSKNSAGAETKYLENVSTCQNNHSFVEGKD